MVCVVCVFGGEASDVIYLLEELRQCKTVAVAGTGFGASIGVWGTPNPDILRDLVQKTLLL